MKRLRRCIDPDADGPARDERCACICELDTIRHRIRHIGHILKRQCIDSCIQLGHIVLQIRSCNREIRRDILIEYTDVGLQLGARVRVRGVEIARDVLVQNDRVRINVRPEKSHVTL